MFALYIDDAGEDQIKRYEVVQVLSGYHNVSFADVKLVLAGVRVRLKTGEVAELQPLKEKLERLGASAVVESCPEGGVVEFCNEEDDDTSS